MAVYAQSRMKLIPFFALGSMMFLTFSGMCLYATIWSAREGRPNILVLAISIFLAAWGLVTAWVGAASFQRPMQLTTSGLGIEVRYLTRKRFWRWSDILGFRLVRGAHGGVIGIGFDYTSLGARKTARLPTCWTRSSDEMIALLESERLEHAGT